MTPFWASIFNNWMVRVLLVCLVVFFIVWVTKIHFVITVGPGISFVASPGATGH